MSTIELERVTKRFAETVAVDDVTLEIPHGRLVCFLGPSGCGKTTTMRMIAGLETPTAGEIRFDAVRINELPPQRRDVGMVFQNYALFLHMSVYDNVAFGLRIRRRAPREIDDAVRRIATLLELDHLLSMRAGRLDLSAMQRVAVARTIVTRPKVLLLDEPLNNIRPGLRERARAELRRLQQEMRQTAVYVTHDQEEALSLGDVIVVMRRGRVEQIGTPDDVYHRPRNVFVAGFVGSPSMNLLPAVVRNEGEPVVEGRGFRLPAHRWAGTLHEGQEVIVGVRPEAVGLGSGPMQARVALIQHVGPDRIIELKLDGQTVRAIVARDAALARSGTVSVDFPLDRAHLFDAASQQLIRG